MASEATKPANHGAAAGIRPQRADWTVDQQWARYSAEEHAVWHTLHQRQSRLLPGRLCDEFLAGMRALDLAADRIPDFRRLSDVLMKHTGWQVVAVAGLVPDEVFFEHLAKRRFPAGRFIRDGEQLDYLSEPDIFHDVFGHVPMLINPVFADYMQAYGEGGLRARRLGVLPNLARVYWYTVEFGLLRQHGALRIYGAGIASSYSESVFALDSRSPHRVGFKLERVMRTRYRIDDFQQIYFVLDGLDELLKLAQIDFVPCYRRVHGKPDHEPANLLADDRVFSRGDGSYHAGRS